MVAGSVHGRLGHSRTSKLRLGLLKRWAHACYKDLLAKLVGLCHICMGQPWGMGTVRQVHAHWHSPVTTGKG